jgi:hypothetical protein
MMTTARSSRHATAQPSAAHTNPPRDGEAQPHRPRAQPLTEQKSGHRCALMIRSWSDHLLLASGWASTFPLKTWSHRATTTENGQPTLSRHHIVLSRAANKTAVARRSKNDTGKPRADQTSPEHLFSRRQGISRFPLASGIYTTAGPRVPTVGPHPSRIHDVHTTTPASTDRIERTDTADAAHGGRR